MSETVEILWTDLQVMTAYGLKCRQTVWRWAKAGKIPKPVRLGKLPRWKKAEIIEHIDSLQRDEMLEKAS